MTNADKFKGIFGIYATELWAKSEEEFLAWLNADVPDTNVGDTISRQAALSLAKDLCVPTADGIAYKHRCIDPDEIRELPSAEPRPRGRWVPNFIYHYEDRFVCTACGRSYKVDTCMGKPIWDFCPNCGADMRGEGR